MIWLYKGFHVQIIHFLLQKSQKVFWRCQIVWQLPWQYQEHEKPRNKILLVVMPIGTIFTCFAVIFWQWCIFRAMRIVPDNSIISMKKYINHYQYQQIKYINIVSQTNDGKCLESSYHYNFDFVPDIFSSISEQSYLEKAWIFPFEKTLVFTNCPNHR